MLPGSDEKMLLPFHKMQSKLDRMAADLGRRASKTGRRQPGSIIFVTILRDALADDEHDRTVGFFQDCGRGLAEEQLLAGAAFDAHHDKIVLALVRLPEDGFVRHGFLPHRGLGIDIVPFTQPTMSLSMASAMRRGRFLPPFAG